MTLQVDVIIVGAGIYGLSAALELRTRGYSVRVLDPGPVPHPLASSTDISKVIRMEYGDDAYYLRLAARARQGWLRWNRDFGETLYHETGLLVLAGAEMAPGQFEHDSYRQLLEHGFEPQRLDAAKLAQCFPAWNAEHYPDGFSHALAGYAESGRVVAMLARRVRQQGAGITLGSAVVEILQQRGQVSGVRTAEGAEHSSRHVVVAAGVWTPLLVPSLQRLVRVVGQPIFHLRCERPELFSPPRFPTFTADISNTGWYGFPVHPREGVIKIANHGIGKALHPDQARSVDDSDEQRLRRFVARSLPSLAEAPVLYRRLCLYCDTLDGHFCIDRHPELDGLVVATGGSGHGFKFAPVLGGLTADALEGVRQAERARFAWRELARETTAEEAARCWRAPPG